MVVITPAESEQDTSLGAERQPEPELGVPPRTPRVRPVVLGLTLALMLTALEPMSVAVALPEIARELHGFDRISSVLTPYLIATGVGALLFGALGHHYGRKGAFQSALLLFVAGSALAGRAQTMEQLIGSRALQGLGAGGLVTGVQAILTDIVRPGRRGRQVRTIGAAFGIASLAGPLLGGYVTDRLSWRWCFYVNVPAGLLVLAIVTLALKLPERPEGEQSPAPPTPRFDLLGALLLASAATFLVLLTGWGGTVHPWDSNLVRALVAGACVATVLLLVVERFAARPLMPLRLLRGRAFGVGAVVGPTTGAALFGVVGLLPAHLRLTGGADATAAGLLMLPLAGAVVGASVVGGHIASRTGRPRACAVLGCAVSAVGLWLLSHLQADTPRLQFGIWTAVLGAGLGMVLPVLVLTVQNSARPADLGAATDVHTSLRQFGGAAGAAVVGGLVAHRFARADGGPAAYADLLPRICLLLVPVLALGLLAACFLRQRPPVPEEPEPLAAEPAGLHAQVPHARSANTEYTGFTEYVDGVPVRGTVRHPDGSAVPRAALTLIDILGRQIGRCAGGDDGRYALAAPGAGSYVLIAAAGGHQPQAVDVTVGERPVDLDVVLGGAGRLAGTVRTSDGVPVAGATVTLTDVHGEVVATVRGGREGTYVVTELPAGEYTLAVSAPAFRPAALPVGVRAACETLQDVELVGGTVLKGTVRAGGGRPVEDARVSLLDTAGNVVGTLTTGRDGAFRFADLSSGEYTLIAAGYAPVATVLKVAAGGRTERDLHLRHEE